MPCFTNWITYVHIFWQWAGYYCIAILYFIKVQLRIGGVQRHNKLTRHNLGLFVLTDNDTHALLGQWQVKQICDMSWALSGLVLGLPFLGIH